MEFEILIPTQEREVALELIDYAKKNSCTQDPKLIHRFARELSRAKYWEAYDCHDESRQEYWRNVLGVFDTIPYNV